jgi:hypothetical protein
MAEKGEKSKEPRSGSLPKNIGHIKELVNDEYTQLPDSLAEAARKADKER